MSVDTNQALRLQRLEIDFGNNAAKRHFLSNLT